MLGTLNFLCYGGKTSVPCCLVQISRKYSARQTFAGWLKSALYPSFADPPYDFICQIGDPVLRQKCDEVDINLIKLPKFQALIKQMWKVQKSFKVPTLSAPQIGLPLQVIVIETDPSRVLINPKMRILDYASKVSLPESCPSMRGFSAKVPRFTSIRIEAINEEGQAISWDPVGLEAIAIQHEIDHLQGVMFVDKMEPKSLEFSLWQQIIVHKGKIFIQYGAPKKYWRNWFTSWW